MANLLRRFIVSQWSSHEDALCLLIPKLSTAGSLTPSKEQETSTAADLLSSKSPLLLATTTAIQAVHTALESPVDHGTITPLIFHAWKYLDVLLSLRFTAASYPKDFIERLEWLLQKILSTTEITGFASLVGKALSLYSRGKDSQKKTLVEQLYKSFPKLGDNAVFLQGTAEFIMLPSFKDMVHEGSVGEMVEKLITNLASPSHEVRALSLRCLEVLYAYKSSGNQVSEIINTAKIIEDTPLVVNNARNIAMYVRRLGIEYVSICKESWERRIVPYYCFGKFEARYIN